MISYVYILKCSDGSFYTGSTKNLIKRLTTHKKGKVKYTKSRLPFKLVFVKEFSSYREAFKFEKRVKSWKKRLSIQKMLGKEDNIFKNYLNFY